MLPTSCKLQAHYTGGGADRCTLSLDRYHSDVARVMQPGGTRSMRKQAGGWAVTRLLQSALGPVSQQHDGALGELELGDTLLA